MNADSTINIGSTHPVCQDYVISRKGYVILSDGCSSSPDTDIGSRLLVKALEQLLKKPAEIEDLHNDAARVALAWANMIGLPPESVDATLMSIHVTGDDVVIACSGDGVIVLESRTGDLDVYVISSPSGYPFYPSYVHQPNRLAELVENDRHIKEIKHSSNITTTDAPTITFKVNAADYKYAAVASDGMTSFYNVTLPDVLNEFWSFKNSHGAFVQRRMKRFKKDT
ncbi:MAG TPA: protein phosphatase 2C domain-containing protein, partial [Pyrinomonadaceae bacterium]|nr:protein phosphatase 2C domain-containing protein [Pyrinomonadaceae bacterium]